MKALQLSREYCMGTFLPAFRAAYPDVAAQTAFGLAGNGSECFGYDDEWSRDHDWGVDFFCWLPDDLATDGQGQASALLRELGQWRTDFLKHNPPSALRLESSYSRARGVIAVGDFYRQLIGVAGCPGELSQWLRIPEPNLALAVNGEVWQDGAGDFSRIRRELLQFYPEDLRLKRLAARCMEIAQTGQYNFERTGKRSEWLTVKLILARFAEAVIAVVFLLNKIYRPYYKWAAHMMYGLPLLGSPVSQALQKLFLLDPAKTQERKASSLIIEEICALLVGELNRQELTTSGEVFLTVQGQELQARIKDPALAKLPAQYLV
ncbi:MAG: DUF4037 domain-containing protein [Coriobacteriales bacterium]|jgi:hypothetical protein|nr:DUF4037 domain-containing protein [Coriobacteriales bacterium]